MDADDEDPEEETDGNDEDEDDKIEGNSDEGGPESDIEGVNLTPRKLRLVDEVTMDPVEFVFIPHPQCVSLHIVICSFRASSIRLQAPREYRLFDEIYASVANFSSVEHHDTAANTQDFHLVPKHLTDLGRSEVYEIGISPPIFTTPFDKVAGMTRRKIRDIFAQRHILIQRAPLDNAWPFDLESLSKLGWLDGERSMQGNESPLL